MKLKNRKAFTMIELIFVIVIIGILSAVAIPKFAMNKDDAMVAKAKNTVAAVRNAIATERQKRILRGKFNKIYSLAKSTGVDKPIFDYFDGDIKYRILEYPLTSCKTSTSTGCWIETVSGSATVDAQYTYTMPLSGSVVFKLKDNRFDCVTPTDKNCKLLTR